MLQSELESHWTYISQRTRVYRKQIFVKLPKEYKADIYWVIRHWLQLGFYSVQDFIQAVWLQRG